MRGKGKRQTQPEGGGGRRWLKDWGIFPESCVPTGRRIPGKWKKQKTGEVGGNGGEYLRLSVTRVRKKGTVRRSNTYKGGEGKEKTWFNEKASLDWPAFFAEGGNTRKREIIIKTRARGRRRSRREEGEGDSSLESRWQSSAGCDWSSEGQKIKGRASCMKATDNPEGGRKGEAEGQKKREGVQSDAAASRYIWQDGSRERVKSCAERDGRREKRLGEGGVCIKIERKADAQADRSMNGRRDPSKQ